MPIEERSTLVFATGVGRVKEEKPKVERPQGDGVVRIQLKRLGGGKMASVVSGIPLDEDELKDLARGLKPVLAMGKVCALRSQAKMRCRRLREGLQHRDPGRQT